MYQMKHSRAEVKVNYGAPSEVPHGIVASHLVEKHSTNGMALRETPAVMRAVLAGLPFAEVEVLREALGISLDRLAPVLGVSKATLHRRKVEGHLTPLESDRVVRYARLLGMAIEVFGSQEASREWFATPQYGLGMTTPLDYAETEAGSREVENLLGRIEYGEYT
jgi:putative toxin-antitoxin system antitoxin component (TIGR02293 family)